MKLAKIAAGWCGFLLFFFGLAYVFATGPMLALAELRDLTPTALADLRVMYGAPQIVPGAFMLASIRTTRYLEPAVLLAASTFACIAAIRVFGIVLDGAATQYHLAALGVEIPTVLLALAGLRSLRRETAA